jgi:hypothetical protein
MRQVLGACVVVCAVLAACGAARAETASVGATIVAPLQVAKVSDLEFGGIIPASSAETVTVDVSGAREVTGGLGLATTVPAAVGARFTVSGSASALFSVALPGSAILSRVGGGATDMAVTDFVSSTGALGVLGANGAQEVVVGATLHVGASQPVGRYTGTFDVTIEYQ